MEQATQVLFCVSVWVKMVSKHVPLKKNFHCVVLIKNYNYHMDQPDCFMYQFTQHRYVFISHYFILCMSWFIFYWYINISTWAKSKECFFLDILTFSEFQVSTVLFQWVCPLKQVYGNPLIVSLSSFLSTSFQVETACVLFYQLSNKWR